MLTKVIIQNFKKLEYVEFSLSQSVVLIGPNNAGKSTIFQALCLWELAVISYIEAEKSGKLFSHHLYNYDEYIGDYYSATLNRKDLLNNPINDTALLWREKNHAEYDEEIDFISQDIPIKINIFGDNKNLNWLCQAIFRFNNTESIECELSGSIELLTELYHDHQLPHFGFLQPMSGLATEEDLLTPGAIARRLGEGRTAEVLRNLCYQILHPETVSQALPDPVKSWQNLCIAIQKMFGAELQEPTYSRANGLLQLTYTENNIQYDITSAGRGFQQTLLLLAYMYANPGTTLLLDEPDAHLEVIRQREIFQLINAVANETGSQLIIASHSEVVLDEAADASNIIAVIDSQAIELNSSESQKRKQINYLKKALTDIGWERYYLARLKKHILYLEGSTDLQMLKQFAHQLQHPAEAFLQQANVHYTANNVPHQATANYVALNEFIPDLRGFALFDKLEKEKQYDQQSLPIPIHFWQRRELENYFARPDALLRFAQSLQVKHPTFSVEQLTDAMQAAIAEHTAPAALRDLSASFWLTAKLSDDWLDLIFPDFYNRLGLPQDFYKRDYYQLISQLQPADIDTEIVEKLDAILAALAH
ncbi:AAA family ATPase [Fibrella sp. WM1]|uniref:AAA family ATPase n=1 Tax=Fibrella musci TaxID=3242485 RepID=UPI00351FBA7F